MGSQQSVRLAAVPLDACRYARNVTLGFWLSLAKRNQNGLEHCCTFFWVEQWPSLFRTLLLFDYVISTGSSPVAEPWLLPLLHRPFFLIILEHIFHHVVLMTTMLQRPSSWLQGTFQALRLVPPGPPWPASGPLLSPHTLGFGRTTV